MNEDEATCAIRWGVKERLEIPDPSAAIVRGDRLGGWFGRSGKRGARQLNAVSGNLFRFSLLPYHQYGLAERSPQYAVNYSGKRHAEAIPQGELPSGWQSLPEREGICERQEGAHGIEISQLLLDPSRRHEGPESPFVVAADMADAPIEFAEEPLVSRRQYHDVPTRPNPACRLVDLTPVVLNVLENVQVKHAIEGRPVRERA